MFEVSEGHELNDVSKDRLSLGRPQDPVVAIQHLHVAEVGIAHAHDDDRHGEVGGVDDGLPGVSHVCDDAVGQDQQDEVLLPSQVPGDDGDGEVGDTSVTAVMCQGGCGAQQLQQ